MTPKTRPTIFALLLCAAYSCSRTTTKPQPQPQPTPPPADTTLSINLMYPNGDTADYGSSYELIIAEPGGKILLDTMAAYNVAVVAKMTTAKAVLNVATVVQGITFSYYGVNIYTSVQPANWQVIPGNPVPLSYPIATTAQVVYTNTPTYDPNSTHFSSLPAVTSAGVGISYDNTNDVVKINYPGRSNDYLYILYPPLGLYSYQPVNTSYDTISLAQMDTTAKVFYIMPAQYTLATTFLTGYPDTTDFSKYQSLYLYWSNQTLADLQYPPQSVVPFQKYALDVDASTATEYINYLTFANTPPTGTLTLPFPVTPIYTLNATANDSFSVTFSQQPTDYGTVWAAGDIGVTIIAPPDSTQVKALPLLTSLNSKLLQGRTLNTLAIQNFMYESVLGVNYNSYFQHQTNSNQMNTKPFASDLHYTKNNP
jgi:hypothetical protein